MNDETTRQRLVKAALGKLKNNPQRQAQSAAERLIVDAQRITYEVRDIIKPVLAAGGWKDKSALHDLITRSYLDRFTKLSKDELENLLTMLHVEIMIEAVNAAPWGNDAPDHLSGH